MSSRVPRLVTCLALLTAADLALRILGFARTLKLVRRVGRPRFVQPQPELVQTTLHQVLKATAFYPGRSLCLEQSLVCFLLLRRRGLPADLRVGVQPFPFSAHAWVEVAGVPITESPEAVAGFSLLPDVAV